MLLPERTELKQIARRYWEADKSLKEAKQEQKIANQKLKAARQELERAKAIHRATIAWCDAGKEMRKFFEENELAARDDPEMQALIMKEIVTYRALAALSPNPDMDEKYLSFWLDQLKTQEAHH